jgi:hypothetical protein
MAALTGLALIWAGGCVRPQSAQGFDLIFNDLDPEFICLAPLALPCADTMIAGPALG